MIFIEVINDNIILDTGFSNFKTVQSDTVLLFMIWMMIMISDIHDLYTDEN